MWRDVTPLFEDVQDEHDRRVFINLSRVGRPKETVVKKVVLSERDRAALEKDKVAAAYVQLEWLADLVDKNKVVRVEFKCIDASVLDLTTIEHRQYSTGGNRELGPVGHHTIRQRIFLLSEEGSLICDVGFEAHTLTGNRLYKKNALKYVRPDTLWGRLSGWLKMEQRSVNESLDRLMGGWLVRERIKFCVTYKAGPQLLVIYKKPKRGSLASLYDARVEKEQAHARRELRGIEALLAE